MIKISYCFLIEPDGGKHHEKKQKSRKKAMLQTDLHIKTAPLQKMLSQIEVDTKGRQERKKDKKGKKAPLQCHAKYS